MKKPNILLIHADQLRADCLSPYGNRDVKTPAIARLAEEGTVYDQHYCVYPVCTPSRYSLLSGQYVHQHLGWGNHCTYPSGLPTFPKILRENGWQTAAVGKMHFTPTYLDMGFDRMTLSEQDGPGRFDDDYHRELMENGLIDDIDLIDQRSEFRAKADPDYFKSFGTQVSDLPEEFHSTSWITRQALRELERWDGENPGFLMVGYIKPHHPFDPPQRYADLYHPEDLTLLPGFLPEVPKQDLALSRGYFDNTTLDEDKLRRILAYYYAAITQIDDGVAQMLDLLRKKGLYENTMILFTSDHGDYMGFHHMVLKGNHMYDPLMRVPLIIRKPDEKTCAHSELLTSNIDVAGEILRECGLPLSPMMSCCPLETGRQYVLAEQMYLSPDSRSYAYMIRDKRYKLLLEGDMWHGMLFDLEEDPEELRNRWEDPALADVKTGLFTCLLNGVAFEGGASMNLDEDAPVNCPENRRDDTRRAEMVRYLHQKSKAGNPGDISCTTY